MGTVPATTREQAAAPVLSQDPALLTKAGEYSLIQLEALAGIALKQATRSLRLSPAAG
jgi:hypothetical protein